MSAPDKSAREQRFRNFLMMRGYRLVRSRQRLSPPKGGYLIVEFAVNQIVAGGGPSPFSLALDEAEAWARQLERLSDSKATVTESQRQESADQS